jgi:hypothetical protein
MVSRAVAEMALILDVGLGEIRKSRGREGLDVMAAYAAQVLNLIAAKAQAEQESVPASLAVAVDDLTVWARDLAPKA